MCVVIFHVYLYYELIGFLRMWKYAANAHVKDDMINENKRGFSI